MLLGPLRKCLVDICLCVSDSAGASVLLMGEDGMRAGCGCRDCMIHFLCPTAGNADTGKQLYAAVQKTTTEELGSAIAALLRQAEQQVSHVL